MASLYERPDSPFFWLKFRDRSGRVCQVSTHCRVGVGPDARRAKVIRNEKSLEESLYGEPQKEREGWAWVSGFLAARHRASPATLERYTVAWANLRLFLDELRVLPQGFRREHCFQYIEWRSRPNKARGKYRCCQNTALMELKVMRLVMQEAIERRIVSANPCIKLGIKRDRPKEKPELSAEDCAVIRSAIPSVADPVEREMLHHSFEIARYQGCRLAETRLDPVNDVDLALGTIRFRSAKGGKDFTTRLHPDLVPLFEDLQKRGVRATWTIPDGRGRQWASAKWWKFLDGLGLKSRGVTFHSTRVTVVTELARANVHESKAQSYVGHSSTTVHRIYQRLRPNDLTDCTRAISAGKPPSSPTSDAPPAT